MKKKILAMILTAVMVVTMIPAVTMVTTGAPITTTAEFVSCEYWSFDVKTGELIVYGHDLIAARLYGQLHLPGNAGFLEVKRSDVKTVKIQNGVELIGDSSFSHTSITSIEIPDSVTFIGFAAFSNTNITSVTIPTYLKISL